MRSYDFQERLIFSNGNAPNVDAVLRIIRNRIPGCIAVDKADAGNDRSGCDYYARRTGNFSLRIDLKLRAKDFKSDDLALETWSVLGRKVGWTRDQSKTTDYVLWYWQDSGRFCLLPFIPLCFVFQRRWELWSQKYETATQSSGSWKSQCVFVSRQIVLDEIVKWSNGKVA